MAQYFFNGLAHGSMILIPALGFWLIYSCNRVLHFAHAAFMLVGVYATLWLHQAVGLPLVAAVGLAVILASFLGALMELGLYRRLRARGGGAYYAFIASMGVYVVITNVVSLIFGENPYGFKDGPAATIAISDAHVTRLQVGVFGASLLLAALMMYVYWRTLLGARVRCVTADPDLAHVMGLNVVRIRMLTLAVGSGIAALSGTAIGMDTSATPAMALTPLLNAIVAVIIGGGTLYGALVGAFILGMTLQLSVVWFPAMWQEAIALVLLLVYLALIRGRRSIFHPPALSRKV